MNTVNKFDRNLHCEGQEADLLTQLFARILSLHLLRAEEGGPFTEDLSLFFDPATRPVSMFESTSSCDKTTKIFQIAHLSTVGEITASGCTSGSTNSSSESSTNDGRRRTGVGLSGSSAALCLPLSNRGVDNSSSESSVAERLS